MKKGKLKMTLTGILLGAGMWAMVEAQSVQVDARLDTTAILIGDQISLHLEVEQQRGIQVVFPVINAHLSPHIEILSISPVDSIKVSDEVIRLRQDVLVTSFDSGRHEIPSLQFPFTEGTRLDTIATAPLQLDVMVMPTDTLQSIADIKPIYELPYGWADIWPWLVGIGAILLVLGIIAFIIYAIVRHNRHLPLFKAVRPPEPPHVVALRALDKLRGEKLWQNNHVKEYYTRMSDIVRTYIEGRFGVSAMEMTTVEIIAGLHATGFMDNSLIERMEKMFSLSDLVKFAKMTPMPNENETALLDSYLFINNTKVQEEEPVAGKEESGKEENNNVEENKIEIKQS